MHSTPPADRDPLYFHSVPTPVPIFQREWEFARALELYVARRPARVLEIGTFHGGTLYHWLRLARPGTQIVSVDSYTAGVDNRERYPEWTPRGVTLTVIAGDSRQAATVEAARAHAPYDWIFIDAGHFLEEVTDDWRNYSPMCAPGGVVLLHDIIPGHHDWLQVDQLWEQLQHEGALTQELTCQHDLDWGGIGVVFR
jgi:predicted O-methyltransferase YrrM